MLRKISTQIQNGRFGAIIDFTMRNVWQAVPDSYTIIINQNVGFQGGILVVVVNHCFTSFFSTNGLLSNIVIR